MASSTEDVRIQLELEKEKQFSAGTARAAKSVKGMGNEAERTHKRFGSLTKSSRQLGAAGAFAGKAMLVGLGGGVLAAGFAAFEATKGWEEHTRVVKRTNAVIKSTGGVANVSAKKVDKMSQALEKQTGIDNDMIQSGANMLLTFTNVRNGVGKNNQIFDRATETVTGMSQALGQDASRSALQLGKALNDPIKGITALKRVGVTFSESQVNTIKSLVESGKTMEAQKIILKELNKEFPRVDATPFQKFQTVLRDLGDTVGKALQPAFNKALNASRKFMEQIMEGTGAGGRFVDKMKLAGQYLNKYLFVPLKKVYEWLNKDKDRLLALAFGLGVITVAMLAFGVATAIAASPVYLIVLAIGLLSAAFFYAYKKSQTVRDGVALLWKILKMTPTAWVITHLGQIIDFISGMAGKIAGAATGIWNGLKAGLVGVINWVIDKINWMIRAFNNTVGRIPGVDNIGELGRVGADAPIDTTGVGNSGSEQAPGGRQTVPNPTPTATTTAVASAAGAPHVRVFLDSSEVGHRMLKSAKSSSRRK